MASTKQELGNVKALLEMAELGLKDLLSDNPDYKGLGLRNLAKHGGSVLAVIQNLESIDPELAAEMKSSELIRYFIHLLHVTELQEKAKLNSKSVSSEFTVDMFNRLPKPVNANVIGFFISDALGGYGWDVLLPDGQKDKFYLSLPKVFTNIEDFVSETPTNHQGLSLEGKSVQEFGLLYYNYLTDLVNRTTKK